MTPTDRQSPADRSPALHDPPLPVAGSPDISGALEPIMTDVTASSGALHQAAPRPTLAILIAVTATGPLALNMILPSMPALAADFGVGYGTAQLTLTLYLVAIALGQLLWGPVSDRYGRRPMLLLGMGVYTLGGALAWLATSIEILLFARVLQALGGSAGIVVTRAIVRDLYGRDQAASKMGYIMMAMSVAPLVAPAAGGLIDQTYDWRAVFLVITVVGATVLVATMADLHETNHDRDTTQTARAFLRDLATVATDREVIGWTSVLALASGAFFAFLAGAPFIMVELLGRTAAEYGFFFALIALGYMLGNFISGRYAVRVGTNRMIVAGLTLGLAGAAPMLALFSLGLVTPWSLFLPMMAISMANGMTLPSGVANVVSVRPELAGAASGFSGATQLGAGAAVTIVLGAIQSDSAMPLAVMIFVSTISAFAALWATPKRA